MVSGSHEVSRLFYHVLEHYAMCSFSLLRAECILFNQHHNTINKGPWPTTETYTNSTISFIHRINADMDAYDDDNEEDTEYQDTILLLLFSNDCFTNSYRKPKWTHNLIVGIVMSKAYVMQENFNETTKCQKEHLISFF